MTRQKPVTVAISWYRDSEVVDSHKETAPDMQRAQRALDVALARDVRGSNGICVWLSQ